MQLLAAGGHGSPPPLLPSGAALGNRAVAALVAQRTPALQREGPAKPGSAAADANHRKAKGKSKGSSYDSLVDLLNDFQDLAAAAVNRQGAGLESIRFGKDLSSDHRYLLNHLRAVMLQGRSQDREERKQAAQSWPWISKKLQAAVAEAKALNFRSDALMAVNDAIAQVGARYFVARRGAKDPEPETFESYRDAINAINDLTFAFERMGESGEGIIREEVPKRKDVAVSQAVIEINKKQRDRLAAVKFGDHLTRQHREALETLRAILITARTETAGSALKAWTRWQRFQGTLNRMLQRTTVFAEVDLGPVQQALANAGETLANHYRVIHTQTVRTALTRERSNEEKEDDRELAGAWGPAMAEHRRENRTIQDFRFALNTIEHNLGPSPVRPDEWVLTQGGQTIRLHAEQGLAIREAARKQVKDYMASLVTAMVEAWFTYDSIKRGTGSTRRKVLGTIGGADDPGDQEEAKNAIIEFRDSVVYKLADEGKYVEALEKILSRKGDVERRARAVGDYDTDLDRGYKRLAIGASVVQVALVSLVPMAGAAAMAPTIVGGVVVAEGASALAVGTTAVAAGATAPALVETGRQLASDEKMDYGKIANTAKTGGLIGFSAVAPVVTNKIAGFIAPGATGTTAVGANMAASSLLGGAQSKASGGSFLEGAAGGGLGSLAGGIVNQVAPVANSPMTNMALQGVAGGGVAYATGQDVVSGVVGGMAGSAGDRYMTNRAGAGAVPAGGTSPDAGDTLPGLGFDGKGPATPSGASGGGGASGRDGPGDTMLGLGFDGRGPAAPVGASGRGGPGDTMLGLGFDGRGPARPTRPEVDPTGTTLPGVVPDSPNAPKPTVASPDALATTIPGARPDTTMPGTGTDKRVPAPGVVSPGGANARVANGGTGADLSIPPDPKKLIGGQPSTKFASLPEMANRKPIMGKIVHIVDGQDEAAALWRRVHAEGKRKVLGTSFGEYEQDKWNDYGGKGDPPLAWVREDGVIRFNLAKFTPPSLGGHSDEPIGPITVPAGAGQGGQPRPATPPGGAGGGPRPRPAYFPGAELPLQPGMRPARPATEAEVRWHADNNPKKVYQAKTRQQYEDWYRMDQGAGEPPDAFWSGGTIVVKPGKPLGPVGDAGNPAAGAHTMPESAYEARPRKLDAKELANIVEAEKRVKAALEVTLAGLKQQAKVGKARMVYEDRMQALAAAPGEGTNKLVLDHAPVAWKALHDPQLIADVLSKAYGAARRDTRMKDGQSDVTNALIREAAKGGPIHVIPKDSDIPESWFFKHWVETGRQFFDLGVGEEHGAITHLLQDLVIDAAFRRAGMSMTARQFRQALGSVRLAGVPDPGNDLWVSIFDATGGPFNQPEILMPAIRSVEGLEKLE